MFATIPPPPNRLLIFARLPELGRVKTRLAQAVGDERALALYEAMLRDVLTNFGSQASRLQSPAVLAGETQNVEIEIVWAPTEAATGDALRQAFGDFPLAMQTGSTLGDRLSMAFSERFFFHRTEKIVAIGVDDPRLSRADVDRAFELLDSCEWVVGPADDGGYYLIGCRAPAFDVEVFTGIEWGSASVLESTLAKIAEWKSSVAMLPQRYDIDTVEDLRRYAAEQSEGALATLLRTER